MIKNSLLLLAFLGIQFTALSAEKQLSSFSGITVNSRIQVEVLPSEKFYAVVEENSNIDVSKLSYNFKGENLIISYTGNLITGIAIKIKIYGNNISNFRANSGSEITISKGYKSTAKKNKYLAFAGGKINAFTTSKITDIEVKQGGSVQLEGTTEQLLIKVITGGVVASNSLKATDVKAEIKFGGEIICNAIETLDAIVTSGGTISYTGNPALTKKIVLGGKIEKIKN